MIYEEIVSESGVKNIKISNSDGSFTLMLPEIFEEYELQQAQKELGGTL